MEVKENELYAMLSEVSEDDDKTYELLSEDATLVESDATSDMLFKFSEKNEVLSPEDAAWVDSCLTFGSEGLSDDTWATLREALLEALAQPTSSTETSTADIDEIQGDLDGYAQVNVEVGNAVIHDGQHILPMDPQEDEDARLETVLSSQEDADSSENIFKVWNLESPDEEDGLINQLKELFLKSRLKVPPSALNDPSMVADDTEIDELITSMANLSF